MPRRVRAPGQGLEIRKVRGTKVRCGYINQVKPLSMNFMPSIKDSKICRISIANLGLNKLKALNLASRVLNQWTILTELNLSLAYSLYLFLILSPSLSLSLSPSLTLSIYLLFIYLFIYLLYIHLSIIHIGISPEINLMKSIDHYWPIYYKIYAHTHTCSKGFLPLPIPFTLPFPFYRLQVQILEIYRFCHF